jgi:hypothetical protein
MPLHDIRNLEIVGREAETPWMSPGTFLVIDFVLDGRYLGDWVSPIEKAAGRERPNYLGHRADIDLRGLLTQEWNWDDDETFDGRVPVLGCVCGDISCGPLCVRIDTEPGWVRWHDIVRWRGPFFDYGDIGFRFPQEVYAAALDRWERDHPGRDLPDAEPPSTPS